MLQVCKTIRMSFFTKKGIIMFLHIHVHNLCKRNIIFIAYVELGTWLSLNSSYHCLIKLILTVILKKLIQAYYRHLWTVCKDCFLVNMNTIRNTAIWKIEMRVQNNLCKRNIIFIAYVELGTWLVLTKC
jgi:hypothetical protein